MDASEVCGVQAVGDFHHAGHDLGYRLDHFHREVTEGEGLLEAADGVDSVHKGMQGKKEFVAISFGFPEGELREMKFNGNEQILLIKQNVSHEGFDFIVTHGIAMVSAGNRDEGVHDVREILGLSPVDAEDFGDGDSLQVFMAGADHEVGEEFLEEIVVHESAAERILGEMEIAFPTSDVLFLLVADDVLHDGQVMLFSLSMVKWRFMIISFFSCSVRCRRRPAD